MTTPPTYVATSAPTRRLAGWQPAGMLDWPGRLTATIFLAGCDFRCPFCHNPSLIGTAPEAADWSALAAHLNEKRGWLDGVVVTGGEPTSDPDLSSLLNELARAGCPIKLDTNGSNPDVLAGILDEDIVSFVALDVKTLPERYEALTASPGAGDAVLQSIELIISSGIAHEFRTTAYPGAVTLDDFAAIARLVEGGDRYAIQQFNPATTLDPRASGVLPYRPDALHAIAASCDKYLPTIVRGAA